MSKRFVRMADCDMVATALSEVAKGDSVGVYNERNDLVDTLFAKSDIPFGNKIALVDMKPGERVIKYGAEIGESTYAIARGELVHVHNVKSLAVDLPTATKKEIMRLMHISPPGGGD